MILDGAHRPPPRQAAAAALPARLRPQGLPERPLHADPRRQPVDDRRPGVLEPPREHAARASRSAVVDDGIDQTSAFLDPKGFTYPAGFPRGQTNVHDAEGDRRALVSRARARARPGTLPLDRKASFHGTHVAGIAAGDAGTTAPAGPDHPEVKGLSGVAPRAWLGNYRVFNAPTPVGNSAFTPQIVAAFEDAVADGMDVINFSGGGPMLDPRNDALVEAVHNVAAAGVVPVISAGNDRDDFGLGSVGAPGTAPDAISVAAVSNTHVFVPTLTVLGAGRGRADRRQRRPECRRRRPGGRSTRSSSTSGRSSVPTASPSTGSSAARRATSRRSPARCRPAR